MATSDSQRRCVFVGNIPYGATEEQLIQICEEVGPVVSFRLVIDRETGKPKGYEFCEYKDEETALSARRNLQGYEINGRQLRVDFAENDKNSDRNCEQGNPSAVSGVLDSTNKEPRRPQVPINSSLITRPAYPAGLPEVKRGAANNLDLLSQPSKSARLNDGISYPLPDANVSMPLPGSSTQVSAAALMLDPDKQASQVPLPSDLESALLQQVLNLTPEQLSALPPDQQKQVIQLQQMLQQPS